MRVILASGSPRRKELLKKIYDNFEVIVSDTDENILESNPERIVEELAARKAKAVFDEIDQSEDALVIGADTIVYYDGEVLGKPEDEEDAKAMLSMLSERVHQVYTGVALYIRRNGENNTTVFSDKTDVAFYYIDRYDIDKYILSGLPLDKAGSYGIQDEFAKHVKGIDGDYNNVVGLPVSKLYQTLKDLKLV